MRHSPKRSVAAVAIALALASAAAVTAVGKPVARYETIVRISNNEPAFHGRVQSLYEECEKRRVKLIRKTVAGKAMLGKTRTDGKGGWEVELDELSLRPGRYYARAARKRTNDETFICQPDRSRAIEID